MEQKFKIGDVVILKSGGPKMTISGDKTGMDFKLGRIFNGSYDCSWFDEKNIKCSGRFPQDSLKSDE